ncbi:unnamed protein product [Auanema sp. JU1783]|nr:unnamed protein product [Auanema sp. JU1783]
MWLTGLSLFSLLLIGDCFNPCVKRTVKAEHIVCVCNTTYCDDFEPLPTLLAGEAILLQSTRSGKRLEQTKISQSSTVPSDSSFTLKLSKNTEQSIMGFGGGFTDAVGINLLTIPKVMRDMIITSYYGEKGLNYVFGRVPMASTDFSTYAYSYDDVPDDFALKNFSLANEDFIYKIPFIKQAQDLAGDRLKLFTAPWAAPGWMKTNGNMKGAGKLIGEVNGKYYQTWTQYFIKFFEEYHKQGIDFWATSMQNEPSNGFIPTFQWQTMYFTAEMERDWLKGLLGPAMRGNNITKDINILILDDQRFNVVSWSNTILDDPEAAKYASGTAVHWYEDNETPASFLTAAYKRHKDHFLIYTESCNGYLEHNAILGDWGRARNYAHSIITDFTNHVSGWVDWNLCLDLQGGPNWVGNFVDAPILIDKDKVEFYKQPMYYILAHFSRYVPVGSKRTEDTVSKVHNDIEHVSFLSPEGKQILVLHNTGNENVKLTVQSSVDSFYYSFISEKHSISTFIL